MIPTSPVVAQRIANRANDAYRRISEKPNSLIFRDAKGVVQVTQTVRVELDNQMSQSQGTPGAASRRKAVVFGVRGHSTQPDTVMVKGWRFTLSGREFEVQSIVLTHGEIQAVAETVN